jgi:Tfp pilus assembly protein PilF
MDEIEARISSYETSLNELPPEAAEDYGDKVRNILIARDELASALKAHPTISNQAYGRIADQDLRLKAVAKTINDLIGTQTLVNWREVKQPPRESWWWFLDERVAGEEQRSVEAEQKRDALWIILTALFVTIALSLIAETVRRFLSGGQDWLTIVNTFVQAPLMVIQAVLGLLAAGSLTDPGRQWIERLLKQLGLYQNYGAKKRLAIAACVLVLALALRLSLPAFAHLFIERGAQYLGQNDQTSAMESYKRAISLNPDSAQAHYSLGTVYENLHRYDDAINEYQQAIALDSKFLAAHNNLARLYLWRGRDKDFTNALQILNDAINLSPADPGIQYVLYKNRGWANYELKNYARAEEDLREAVRLDQKRPERTDNSTDRAAPHCLLGYVLEAEKKEAALDEWDDCFNFSPGEEDLKAEWISTAKSRIESRAEQ